MTSQLSHHVPLTGAGLRPALLSLLLPFLVIASGCSVIRKEIGEPLPVGSEALSRTRDYHEVLDVLGPPHSLNQSEHGMTFLYEQVDLTEKQVGISLGVGDVSLFKLVVAREIADRQVLVITFDADGLTRSVGYREWSEVAATGAALQLIVVVAGVAGAGELTEPPPAHQWGFGLLEADLPRLLNRGNSPETGNAGVEQKGTPTNAGQRTLELR